MTATTETHPTNVSMWEIPRYFGGNHTRADADFDMARNALVALTKLPEDDAALRLILNALDDALVKNLEQARAYGRAIGMSPEFDELYTEQNLGLDEWPDEAFMAFTGESSPWEKARIQ